MRTGNAAERIGLDGVMKVAFWIKTIELKEV
jgi:hypothetical protein